MLDNLFREAADKITSKKSNRAYFSDRLYKPIDFDISNLHAVGPYLESSSRICFIDGGNIEIVGNNNFSLSLVRVYSSIWKSGKRTSSSRDEYCIFVESDASSKEIAYLARIFKDGNEIEKISFPLTKADELVKPESIVGNARRILELRCMLHNCEILEKDDIICLDGSFLVKEDSESLIMDKAVEAIRKKSIILASVCKTSSVLTDSGDNLVGALSIMAREADITGIWYYENICENRNPKHDSELLVAKMHSKAEFSFMVEIGRFCKDKISHLISELAENSRDPIFLGYPYGLVDADKNARCTKEEQGFLFSRFMHNCKDQRKVQILLNTNKAHGILDRIK